MSNSIDLIKQAEKKDRNTKANQESPTQIKHKHPPRPTLNTFKFRTQKPKEESIISPEGLSKAKQDAYVDNNSSSMGLKVEDDSPIDKSDKEKWLEARNEHLRQLKDLSKGSGLSRRSLNIDQTKGSPLMPTDLREKSNNNRFDDDVGRLDNALSPGDSFSLLDYVDERYSPSFQDAFYRNEKGQLMCENLRVTDIAKQCGQQSSPFYLMSKGQIDKNYLAYSQALDGLDSFIGYAVKANHNFNLLKHLAQKGSGAVLVSGNEILTALKAGFSHKKMVYNGNGKTVQELHIAIKNRILINIDSEFDLENIIQVSAILRIKARTLLRINPDIDPKVHHYVSTGLASSKFGIRNNKLDKYLQKIYENGQNIELVGVHCHIGSTITEVQLFRDATSLMIEFIKKIRDWAPSSSKSSSYFNIKYLNIGGGLGINYKRDQVLNIPKPLDLINSVRDLVEQNNLKLIIEPGRSMVGNTCILVNKVIGVKSNGLKNFIVTDGSMSELIRPSLYNTYHHIELAEPCNGQKQVFDIVGPVCESADFLGKERALATPSPNDCLVVFDTGAYCQSMSSVYNMKLTCAEYWVEDMKIVQIRKAMNLDTYLDQFDCIGEQTQSSIYRAPQVEPQRQNQIYQPADSSGSSGEKSSNVGNHQQKNTHSIQVLRHYSATSSIGLLIDQIDECEDENSPLMPKKGYLGLRIADSKSHIETNSHMLSSNAHDRQIESDHESNKKEPKMKMNFYIEQMPQGLQGNIGSQNSDSSKSFESQPKEYSDDPYDSEEDDIKFAQMQQQQLDEEAKKQLDQDGYEKNPFQLNIGTLKLPEPKLRQKQKEQEPRCHLSEDSSNDSPLTISPTFKLEGEEEEKEEKTKLFQTPLKISPLNNLQARRQKMMIRSETKQDMTMGKSKIEFMTEKKQGNKGHGLPFEINPNSYETLIEKADESSYSLTQNNGGEIDYDQLTSNKKKPKQLRKIEVKANSSYNLDQSFGKDQVQPKVADMGGIKGLGSAGMRYQNTGLTMPNRETVLRSPQINRNQQSSTSSRRDAFRNRILSQKGLGSFSGFEAFNKFNKGGDSSVSSRHVVRLAGNDTDADIVSQQEDEYKNVFEKLYIELEDLGEGCSSVVKKCENKISKHIRAVKIIRNDDEEYIQSAENEYNLLKGLNHPQIVKMYDKIHDDTKGTLYLVMEYVEGQTLEDYVYEQNSTATSSEKTFIKESFIHHIFRQLIEIVKFIHSKGICHRDLKPDNILINKKTSEIKLMDFNVSKRFRELEEDTEKDTKPTIRNVIQANQEEQSDICLDNQQNNFEAGLQSHELMKEKANISFKTFKIQRSDQKGTKIIMRTQTGLDQWSAPETRQGCQYSEAIDLWGVGVMLFFAITSKPPFISHDEELLKQIVQDCQISFSQDCLDFYSEDCIDLIKHLIVKDPEERFTVEQVMDSDWFHKKFETPASPLDQSPKSPLVKEPSPVKTFEPSSYISPRKDQRTFQNPIISGLQAQNSAGLSASDKNDQWRNLLGSGTKVRKSSDNDFLETRKESREHFDLNGRKISQEEQHIDLEGQRKMSCDIQQDQDQQLLQLRKEITIEKIIQANIKSKQSNNSTTRKKERERAQERQKETCKESKFKNKSSIFQSTEIYKDSKLLPQKQRSTAQLSEYQLLSPRAEPSVLTPKKGNGQQNKKKQSANISSNLNLKSNKNKMTLEAPLEQENMKENQILSTFLSNSQPNDSELADDMTPSGQSHLIKLQKVNPQHTGYSSDSEGDIDPQALQQFLGNKNSKYKSLNQNQAPSRYHLDHKLKKKFEKDSKDKSEDSGYDEDQNSSTNNLILLETKKSCPNQIKKMHSFGKVSPLFKDKKKRNNHMHKKAMDLLKKKSSRDFEASPKQFEDDLFDLDSDREETKQPSELNQQIQQ